MIEFVSLLLGLLTGVQPVEVAVSPEVAAVELLLDGVPAGRLESPPWRIAVDFGDELVPRELEAVAYGADGRELGRTRQSVNLPRRYAEARLLVDREAGRARLVWQAVDFERPASVRLTFDGEPLAVDSWESFALPPYDPEHLHLLRAELVFSESVQATADLVFGGGADRTERELTAVALSGGGVRSLAGAELAGRLTARGEPVPVLAVERPPIELLVVRERSSWLLGRLARLSGFTTRGGRRTLTASPLRFEPADRLRFVFPVGELRQSRGARLERMPVSVDVSALLEGDLRSVLTRVFFDDFEGAPADDGRIADAVAVAGLEAAALGRRRAVLLLVSGGSEGVEDVSRFRPAQVSRYLARLGVPLFVWVVPGRDGETATGWEEATEVREIPSRAALSHALRRLDRHLEAQAIAWVEGRWLPHEVAVAPGGEPELATLARPVGLPATVPGARPERLAGTRPGRSAGTPASGSAGAPGDRPAPGEPVSEPSVPIGKRALWRLEPGPPLPVEPGPESPGTAAGLEPQDLVAAARRHLGDDARSARLGPFPLLTDVPASRERRLDELAATAGSVLELYRERYRLPAPAAGRVVLFARDAARRAFLADVAPELASGSSGAALGARSGHAVGEVAVLALEGVTDSELPRLLAHELVHLLNRETLGAALPPWLDEGLAGDLTLARIDRRGRLVPLDLGRPLRPQLGPVERARASRPGRALLLPAALAELPAVLAARRAGTLPPLPELLGRDRERFLAAPDPLGYTLYALWVRHLSTDRHLAPRFLAFLERATDGAAVDAESLRRALGASWDELERGFGRYLAALPERLGLAPEPGRSEPPPPR